MDLRQLQYIVAIADENNITHAAEKLYHPVCPQPAASETGKRTRCSAFPPFTYRLAAHRSR